VCFTEVDTVAWIAIVIRSKRVISLKMNS